MLKKNVFFFKYTCYCKWNTREDISELPWEQCRNGQQKMVHQIVILNFFLLYCWIIIFWSMFVSMVSVIDLKHFKMVILNCMQNKNIWKHSNIKHLYFIFSGISKVKWSFLEFYLIHIGWKDQFSWLFVLFLQIS